MILGWSEMYPRVSKIVLGACKEEVSERDKLHNRERGYFHSFTHNNRGTHIPNFKTSKDWPTRTPSSALNAKFILRGDILLDNRTLECSVRMEVFTKRHTG
jgi:hypothetical protein